MAYLDQDDHVLLWLATALRGDLSTDLPLMAKAEEPENEVVDPESSRGYVIQDWFGPFLFSPARRHQRNRC